MTDMKSNNDIKASTQRGNINYHFGEKPKNTLLKLHPGHGNKEIKIDISIKEKWEIAIIYWNFTL